MKLFFYFIFAFFLCTSHNIYAQVRGCTDPLSTNYNPAATINDGSCVYAPASITPLKSTVLPTILRETSGLFLDGDSLWTHNDDADKNLYKLSISDSGYRTIPLQNITNIEWEEIGGDSTYLYLGDFGNNSSGNRTNLHILRIEKSSALQGIMHIDTIHFTYEDQNIQGASASNTTDFDCEAMVIGKDSIYLFSKMWSAQKTTVYSIPKVPGTYKAIKKGIIDVQGLITGATFLEEKKMIILCGYSTLLQPFLYLLYDYPASDFGLGNKRKMSLALPFHQVEGIATHDGKSMYCTNERFTQSFLDIPQALHHIDISQFTSNYLSGNQTSVSEFVEDHTLRFYPNPADEQLSLEVPTHLINQSFSIFDILGIKCVQGTIANENVTIDIHNLSVGVYFLLVDRYKMMFVVE